MTHKIYEFDPVIYPRLLWIAVGVPTAVLNDMFEDKLEDMAESSNAEVINARRLKPDVKGGVLIRFRSKRDMTANVTTHEAAHAALEIFDYIGAFVDFQNQEPFCYLVGWIAKCIDKVKRGKE